MQNDWYEIVDDGILEQGDILFQCPVAVLVSQSLASPNEQVEVDVPLFDVIVMTQSCDLENGKTSDVVLCAHWDVKEAECQGLPVTKKDALKEIQKGRRPRYTLLNSSKMIEPPLSIRVVDCGKVFCLPFSYVQELAVSHGPHLRLRSPYREHLSQEFARFFMRVGLPQDIDL